MKMSIVIAVLNSHEIVRRQVLHFGKMNLPKDVEIILVDDGSNPPLTFFNCPVFEMNLSIYYTHDKRPWTQGLARNAGALVAKGEYLFFTDIDHIITREAIDDVLKFNGDKMVFPRYFGIFNEEGNIISDQKSMLEFGLNPLRLKGRRGFFGGYHGNTYAIRKTIFEKIGRYSPRYCQSRFHVGGKYPSEEGMFNHKYAQFVVAGYAKEQDTGSKIYFYPIGRFRTDGSNNPFGLFHGLSLEQVPQPMME